MTYQSVARLPRNVTPLLAATLPSAQKTGYDAPFGRSLHFTLHSTLNRTLNHREDAS